MYPMGLGVFWKQRIWNVNKCTIVIEKHSLWPVFVNLSKNQQHFTVNSTILINGENRF